MMLRSVIAVGLFSSSFAEEFGGISLLQTHAHVGAHVQLTRELPDPKNKSAKGTGSWATLTESRLRDNIDQVDFQCKGGKGKWALTAAYPSAAKTDLSQETQDIKAMNQPPGYGYKLVADRAPGVEPSKTFHGPVKNEKDCFARARIDYQCNQWMDQMKYSMGPLVWGKPIVGVWYKPYNWPSFNGGTCYCGVGGKDRFESGMEFFTTAEENDKPKLWFCLLEREDSEGVDENTPTDLSANKQKEPKDKKSPEDRAACRAAKSNSKDLKKAWKDLRAQLKDLRAQLKDMRNQVKAAKAAFKEGRDAQNEVC